MNTTLTLDAYLPHSVTDTWRDGYDIAGWLRANGHGVAHDAVRRGMQSRRTGNGGNDRVTTTDGTTVWCNGWVEARTAVSTFAAGDGNG